MKLMQHVKESLWGRKGGGGKGLSLAFSALLLSK